MIKDKNKVSTDPLYIAINRFDCSLSSLLDRYPDQVPDHVIQQALMLSEEEMNELYNSIVLKIRKDFNVKIS
jgi:hypothetical protein